MHTYNFEKLDVWEKSRKLVVKIYKLTKDFPIDEKYGMVSQMRRAAVSICSNIAEGSGRTTSKDQSRFYTNVYSSLLELLNQVLIAEELGWVNSNEVLAFRKMAEEVSNKINALRNAALKRLNASTTQHLNNSTT